MTRFHRYLATGSVNEEKGVYDVEEAKSAAQINDDGKYL